MNRRRWERPNRIRCARLDGCWPASQRTLCRLGYRCQLADLPVNQPLSERSQLLAPQFPRPMPRSPNPRLRAVVLRNCQHRMAAARTGLVMVVRRLAIHLSQTATPVVSVRHPRPATVRPLGRRARMMVLNGRPG